MSYYSENYLKYIDETLKVDMSHMYKFFLEHLSKDAKALMDLGFGSGRDSLYFKQLGYKVLSVDPTPEFCSHGITIGLDVLCKKAEELDFDNEFDGIWACASLLHVPSKEFPNVLIRCKKALKEFGVMYCSFKYGSFEGYRNGRWFLDMNEKLMTDIVSQTGLTVVDTIISHDARPNREERWLNVILKK